MQEIDTVRREEIICCRLCADIDGSYTSCCCVASLLDADFASELASLNEREDDDNERDTSSAFNDDNIGDDVVDARW
jgi:hypothetical protein